MGSRDPRSGVRGPEWVPFGPILRPIEEHIRALAPMPTPSRHSALNRPFGLCNPAGSAVSLSGSRPLMPCWHCLDPWHLPRYHDSSCEGHHTTSHEHPWMPHSYCLDPRTLIGSHYPKWGVCSLGSPSAYGDPMRSRGHLV